MGHPWGPLAKVLTPTCLQGRRVRPDSAPASHPADTAGETHASAPFRGERGAGVAFGCSEMIPIRYRPTKVMAPFPVAGVGHRRAPVTATHHGATVTRLFHVKHLPAAPPGARVRAPSSATCSGLSMPTVTDRGTSPDPGSHTPDSNARRGSAAVDPLPEHGQRQKGAKSEGPEHGSGPSSSCSFSYRPDQALRPVEGGSRVRTTDAWRGYPPGGDSDHQPAARVPSWPDGPGWVLRPRSIPVERSRTWPRHRPASAWSRQRPGAR